MEKQILKRQKRGKLVAVPPTVLLDHWVECAAAAGSEPFRIWLSPDAAVILTAEPTRNGVFSCVIMWRTSREVSRFGHPAADLETLAAGVQKVIDHALKDAVH